MKENKGITLIALVITIIVLLILAGVSIAMISGNNGILSKTGEAITKQQLGTAQDKCVLIASDELADYYYGIYVNVDAADPKTYNSSELSGKIVDAIVADGDLADGVTAAKEASAPEGSEAAFKLTYTDNSCIYGKVTNGKVAWYGYNYAGNN